MKQAVRHPSYTEEPGQVFPEESENIWTPTWFMARAWEAYNRRNYNEAIKFSTTAVDAWLQEAKQENDLKKERIGGLIYYPWGTRNEEIEEAIWKYPLLNEVGAACWVAAASHFQQGNQKKQRNICELFLPNFLSTKFMILVLLDSGMLLDLGL